MVFYIKKEASQETRPLVREALRLIAQASRPEQERL